MVAQTFFRKSVLWGALIGLLLPCMSVQAQSQKLNVDDWINRPGVRMLAVDFYATWCQPCMDAVPRWKALHEKYEAQGLRLVVVATQDPDGQCNIPEWNPNQTICDPDGSLANAMNVGRKLPAAFLWNWRGKLLVRRGHVNEVAQMVEKELQQAPRIVLNKPKGRNAPVLTVANALVRAELSKNDKVVVVAEENTGDALADIRKSSHNLRFKEKRACKLGQALSANSLLKTGLLKLAGKQHLTLQLYSAEKSCFVAGSRVLWQPSRPMVSVAEAVSKLMHSLRIPTEMPTAMTQKTAVITTAGQKGLLRLTVDQRNVELTIDGKSRGTQGFETAMDLSLPIRSRPYRIMLTKLGFHRYSGTVTLSGSSPKSLMAVQLLPKVVVQNTQDKGFVTIKSTPDLAAIKVDKKVVLKPDGQPARTPYTLELSTGPHLIQLERRLYKPWAKVVKAPANMANNTESVSLKPNFGTLDVRANYSNAQILINDEHKSSNGRYINTEEEAGTYKVTVNAPLYHSWTKHVIVEPGSTAKPSISLKPAFGGIELTLRTELTHRSQTSTCPQIKLSGRNESVGCDRKKQGNGHVYTYTLRRKSSGKYEIEAAFKHYDGWLKSIDVKDGETARVSGTLTPRFGSLSVSSSPAGAVVKVDGNKIGTTPLSVDWEQGTYRVTVLAPSQRYRDHTTTVGVSSGKNSSVSKTFETVYGGKMIISDPPGATVFVDGIKKGVTPLALRKLPRGTVKLRLESSGFTPFVEDMEIQEGKMGTQRYSLTQLGSIEVRCNSKESERGQIKITVGGQTFHAHQKVIQNLATGRHKVTCSSPTAGSVSRTYSAAPGNNVVAQIDLRDPKIILANWSKKRRTYIITASSLLVAGVGSAIGSYIVFDTASIANDRLQEATQAFESATTTQVAENAKADIASAQDERSTNDTTGWILAGVGAVSLAASVTLYILSPPKPIRAANSSSVDWSTVPWMHTSGEDSSAGLSVMGRF